MEELKFKPGQLVVCSSVKSASSVGYLGTEHRICDYVKSPGLLKHGEGGETLYPCVSERSGYFAWFYESELMTPSEWRAMPPRKPRWLP